MYITDAYARILCDKCKKQIQILMPGQPFEGIAKCDCGTRVEEVPFTELTVIGLKKELQARGLSYGSKDTKDTLIALLEGK